MRDKRPVDELTIEELERVLAIRRREERQRQLERMKRSGRVVEAEKPKNGAPAAVNGTPAVVMPPKTASLPLGNAPQFEDADDAAAELLAPQKAKNEARTWRQFIGRSTLVLEILAILGLFVMGYGLLEEINNLQRETGETMRVQEEVRRAGIPTLVPTPQIRLDQVVLPSGHAFTESGAPMFNIAEIPAHLQASVVSAIYPEVSQRPPTTSETALGISIPAINVDAVIVQGVDWDALSAGVGQLPNGTNPGDESGNLVLAAHNDIYGEIFRYLDQLNPGDRFEIRTQTGSFIYEIRGWEIVAPDAVYVMDPTDTPTATLISCYPYRVSDQRIVVFADRIEG